MGWFENFAERQFRKFVHKILLTNVDNFENFERSFPQSTVDTAYKAAWDQFGKHSHNKPPAIYREEAVKAAEYVMEFYRAFLEVAAGGKQADG